MTPKAFLFAKAPQTNVERIACLAYYLTHNRNTPFFKTLDISKLNTEAAQPKFANSTYSLNDAVRANLLVQASKGQKQISVIGERYVQALPDRAAARAVLISSKRPRPRKQTHSEHPQTSGHATLSSPHHEEPK
jgi:lysine/ornithine N-monooxygenase